MDRIAEDSKKHLKQENMGMIKENSSALLTDLGDGVLGLLFTADVHFLDGDAFAGLVVASLSACGGLRHRFPLVDGDLRPLPAVGAGAARL